MTEEEMMYAWFENEIYQREKDEQYAQELEAYTEYEELSKRI